MKRGAIPVVQSPLPLAILGFTFLTLLACCTSCSEKKSPSGANPSASGLFKSRTPEKDRPDVDTRATSPDRSIQTEITNTEDTNTEHTTSDASSPSLAKSSALGLPSIASLPSADSVAPSEPPTTKNFQVKIVGLENALGSCLIAVYASPSGFRNPDVAIAKETIQLSKKNALAGQIKNDELVWSFALPPEVEASRARNPPGAYGFASNEDTKDAIPEIRLAITAFHDANENGALDKSAIGIPTEKYGFSNNPAPGFGPPSFDQTAIPLSQWKSRSSLIEIKLR